MTWNLFFRVWRSFIKIGKPFIIFIQNILKEHNTLGIAIVSDEDYEAEIKLDMARPVRSLLYISLFL